MKHRSAAWRSLAVGVTASVLASLALAATPTEMKAIVQNGNGGPEVLKYQTVPVREPATGQVLIRVYAAAVNPVDWKMRNGISRGGGAPRGEGGPPGSAGGPPSAALGSGPGGPPGGGPTTTIPGMDVAGVVEKLGSGVTNVKVGDAVFSMLGRGISGMNGGYSQYALAPATNVVSKPKNVTYAQAAGLGTAGMTGVRTVNGANVSKGQKVLILGVAGGVGSAAAQIAKARGATVVGTASARHNAYLKTIGVDQVIDYTKGNFEDQVKDVDVVINTVTGDSAERSLKTLKKGGTLASVAGNVGADKCAAAGVKCAAGGPPGPGGPSEGDMLAEVGKLVSAGKYGVNVDKTFPLEKAADAQVYSFDGHAEGKIILIVDPANANIK
jgi:NADPH:quinone reductase-like Zn-dependent oxidoreductase